MSAAKRMAIELINELPDDKVFKLISYGNFIANEDDVLVLTDEEDEEIALILENDEFIDVNELFEEFLGKKK